MGTDLEAGANKNTAKTATKTKKIRLGFIALKRREGADFPVYEVELIFDRAIG